MLFLSLIFNLVYLKDWLDFWTCLIIALLVTDVSTHQYLCCSISTSLLTLLLMNAIASSIANWSWINISVLSFTLYRTTAMIVIILSIVKRFLNNISTLLFTFQCLSATTAIASLKVNRIWISISTLSLTLHHTSVITVIARLKVSRHCDSIAPRLFTIDDMFRACCEKNNVTLQWKSSAR